MSEKPPELRVTRPDEAAPPEESHGRGLAPTLARRARSSSSKTSMSSRSAGGHTHGQLPGRLAVHLGYTERLWFRAIAAGEPDGHGLAGPHVRAARRMGESMRSSPSTATSARLADAALDRVGSLDQPSAADFGQRHGAGPVPHDRRDRPACGPHGHHRGNCSTGALVAEPRQGGKDLGGACRHGHDRSHRALLVGPGNPRRVRPDSRERTTRFDGHPYQWGARSFAGRGGTVRGDLGVSPGLVGRNGQGGARGGRKDGHGCAG